MGIALILIVRRVLLRQQTGVGLPRRLMIVVDAHDELVSSA